MLYGPDRKDNCSEKIISVNSIHEAFDYVNKLVFKPGILLFTASDSDAEFSIKSFKSHVLKSQIQKWGITWNISRAMPKYGWL